MNFTMNIPGLKDVIITKMEQVEDRVALHVELEVQLHRCPRCQEKIKHLKWFERLTYLFYKKRRYVCGACGKKFAEQNPFIERYQRFSKEWNQAVQVRSVKAKTFKEVAGQYGASASTIVRRFDRVALQEVAETAKLPHVIAIDEYKGDTREGKYQLIIANGETREPIDILPNRKKATIKQYLQQHGAAVKIVVMDMSPSFKAAVRQALGKPVIIADRFHFCRYIYWVLDGVRRRVQKNWNDYDRKKGKRMRYVFYKNSAKLTEEDRWYLKRYLEMDDELKRAYELKEAYCLWFQASKKRNPEELLETRTGLLEFYQLVTASGIPEFQKAIGTFRNWQTEISNSFAFLYSNGFLEGINNLTKVIKRNAFGFQNFERARAKILLTHKYKNIGVHVG